jgi:hypothetical protein
MKSHGNRYSNSNSYCYSNSYINSNIHSNINRYTTRTSLFIHNSRDLQDASDRPVSLFSVFRAHAGHMAAYMDRMRIFYTRSKHNTFT